LPEDLLDRVDKTVKQESLGYSSRAEFIKEAVRLRLEQLEKLKNTSKLT
jgi:metal-responsive CopG/Arc/MetJ family transcriptional regulator